MYDVIVVGARCAGAATALLLARAGRRVLLLDRARFPSDTLSTLYIHQPGLARLDRWGLLGEVLATGAPLLTRLSLNFPGARLTGPAPALGAITGGCAPRRYALDHLLVQAAIRAGAEFRPRTTVVDLQWEDGKVTGVRHGTPRGSTTPARAHLVIGADGRNSTVARLAHAPVVRQDPRSTRAYYSYWSGIPDHGVQIYTGQGMGAGCIPTQDGLTLVSVQVSRTTPAHDNRQRTYREMARKSSAELDQQLTEGKQEDRLYCCSDLPNFFRRPHGPGWVLVGDAAHNKDPTPGRGITDAFIQAEMLAEYLDIPIDDTQQVDAASVKYARQLREEFTPAYESALVTARLDPTEYIQHLIDNQHDPAFTDRFFHSFSGIS
ncbi:FAD-dependent oxidoreductase (plasmid) [Streptomyces scopuliridis]|uniref:NAD(P)/FAD-dependent oxidoreductase n=1 Tax=Streptomyces scopuliridis TaxID=452529 RepID=UPI002DDBEBDF|nr:FAD-dependent oxidoreductase [Streptomyces scopuliridis]WSB39132.1 FAD-dependent oxidoreductase [Streptomyces scopuliridis]